ncbi:hypothetical protein GYMLUDRAFT_1019883 [Collybiopsis luxurians FD-317 M1]|nr:hypothetical protein GYMLUDRAFT_1019883 [Collybiopsis luxurians FD-317 M1]
MVISGSNAALLSQDVEIFYDAEIFAIVHRFKSKGNGLVGTTVWGWFGKNSVSGELEQSKLQELAQRYRTTLIAVEQYAEPLDMLQVLGHQLTVRQGKRVHWSADNTAMHVIRRRKGVVFIDELELSVRNLCSGFSYCLSVLDTVYVWHGRGSVASEQRAALNYGRKLSGNDVVELHEGQSEGDEMFWMILGEDAFANANYWQWRSLASDATPGVWVVDKDKVRFLIVKSVDSMKMRDVSFGVHVVDCIWEFFVLVGSEARSQRQDIRLALHVAKEFVRRVAGKRPHVPPIHVLILPSQVPLDFKLHFRELDESLLNLQDVPDHMNLLSLDEAHDHLQRKFWERFALRDPFFLPLGIHPDLL